MIGIIVLTILSVITEKEYKYQQMQGSENMLEVSTLDQFKSTERLLLICCKRIIASTLELQFTIDPMK